MRENTSVNPAIISELKENFGSDCVIVANGTSVKSSSNDYFYNICIFSLLLFIFSRFSSRGKKGKESFKIGDIVTVNGILGEIIEINDNIIQVKISQNNIIRVLEQDVKHLPQGK